MKLLKIGEIVRVRCICGKVDCYAPAVHGGVVGELIDINNNEGTVLLDNGRTATFNLKYIFREKV